MPESLAPPSIPVSCSSSSSLTLNDSSDCPSMLFSDSLSSDSFSDTSDSLSYPPSRDSRRGSVSSAVAFIPEHVPSQSHGPEKASGSPVLDKTPKALCCAVIPTEDAGYEADYEGRGLRQHKCFVHGPLAALDQQRRLVPRRRWLSLLPYSVQPAPSSSLQSPAQEEIKERPLCLSSVSPAADHDIPLITPLSHTDDAPPANPIPRPAPQRRLSPRVHYVRGSLGHPPQQQFNRWQRMDYQHRNLNSLGSGFPLSQSYNDLVFDSVMLMAEHANSSHTRRHSISGLW
ncbi:hypothetical protein OE88DRAFT_1809216 [Heliocybe sulcata]|uniref:Uncharacterized protein n=1 Tax=Heliocybe sulcata TaxID=5364 RepID=A0A5C3N2A9_9AGAM|nr:hypothetical protein OE88DRAFT_1809216 [Heliocybe sulcata]